MKHFIRQKQSRQENLIYLVVWGLLFAAPLLSLYVRTVSDADTEFDWGEVFIVWRHFSVFLLLFVVHNFLLAPLLVQGFNRMVYFSVVAVIIAVFSIYQCCNRPVVPSRPHAKPHEESVFKPDRPRHHPSTVRQRRPPRNGTGHPFGPPPPIIGEHDILTVMILILMFGANVGIKGYFRGRDDRKRLAELERQNLEQQLEYLRYQINPHFFVNTLNNIHALVDIDPEKAKDTILELSKMMRFVLYDGAKQCVPLYYELDFIRHYVALMQLRYTDKVKIRVDLPESVPNRQIPPLILITFIENAFKHGVTYQHESFIEVVVKVEKEELQFTCRNSKANKPNEEKGGVGLVNIRKRLDLLYDNHYTLRVDDTSDEFTVVLVIPLINQPQNSH